MYNHALSQSAKGSLNKAHPILINIFYSRDDTVKIITTESCPRGRKKQLTVRYLTLGTVSLKPNRLHLGIGI